ncbi:hypothetical protein F511_44835 [Dorcoceras hygrometricum]|uniref:Uncharacterized protein n=1 Tax=Dorcoceras hygrometricum TaxID=472368 RepID=A0A2Z7B3S5_9LAMI|nr:hypothetical protein F511_44835 [Dorcoceras hygrometricum]
MLVQEQPALIPLVRSYNSSWFLNINRAPETDLPSSELFFDIRSSAVVFFALQHYCQQLSVLSSTDCLQLMTACNS